MTDLPRKGDRVRVTEVSGDSKFNVGDEITLEMDALQHHDDWVYFDFVPTGDRFPVFSGAVKVELLERATPADLFADFTSDEDQSESDYTRGRRDGMRRVVEIAERMSDPHAVGSPVFYLKFRELKESVEKELK